MKRLSLVNQALMNRINGAHQNKFNDSLQNLERLTDGIQESEMDAKFKDTVIVR